MSSSRPINPILCWCDAAETLVRALPGYTGNRGELESAFRAWEEEAAELKPMMHRAAGHAGEAVLSRFIDRLENAEDAISLAVSRWGRAALELHRMDGPSPLTARSEAFRAIEKLRELDALCTDPCEGKPALTDQQREIWDLLDGCALSAKEIAVRAGFGFDQGDLIRKRIARIKRQGHAIKNRRGLGYYRPDAPPPRPDAEASG